MTNKLETREAFESILEKSSEKPQIILKHSTRCPTSRGAFLEFERFAEKDHRADLWTLLVIEHKDVSQMVAEETGIEHQSPQAIIIKDGRPVWHGSHHVITAETLGEKLPK
jgi:bacillithiol system protein YtxJ